MEENDFEEIEERLKINKSVQEIFEKFIESESNIDEIENFNELIKFIKNEKISEDRQKLKYLLYLISAISKNHHRSLNFFNKIDQILHEMKNSILNLFSNTEIFHIFLKDKRILLFLIKQEVIIIDEYIVKIMKLDKYSKFNYKNYFFIEIKKFLQPNEIEEQQNEIENFEEKRKMAENDCYICQLIQKDEIDEFIKFVNQTNYSLSSEIKPSIFETNNLLIKKNPTLIQYSAFYGSIKIFKYLYVNNIELTPSLFIYAIHGRNNEIIHFLEEKILNISKETIEKCIFESIKTHHNEFIDYFINNYVDKINQSIFLHFIQYYDFLYLDFKENLYKYDQKCFNYLCKYDYYDVVKLLLKSNNYFNIKSSLLIAIKKGKMEIASLLIEKVGIPIRIFSNCIYLTEISIPFSVTVIERSSFSYCSSLVSITFPHSLTTIGERAFSDCSSLIKIEIPSVTYIGEYAFERCISLIEVKLPSSMSEVKNGVFKECKSLQKIVFPSKLDQMGNEIFNECSSLIEFDFPLFIKTINESTFKNCTSLKRISIHSFLIEIRDFAFQGCSSLEEIYLPSSLKIIGSRVFEGCSSLKNVEIPSSVFEINFSTFSECFSLTKISIPSSVIKIGAKAFNKCISLQQISIPSSIIKIEDYTFDGCSSINKVELTSSILSIGEYSFRDCIMLKEIEIPNSVTRIGCYAFDGCESLKEIKIPILIKKIKSHTFSRCSSLEYVTIPFSVTLIGACAFAECSSLKQVTIPPTIKEIRTDAFPSETSLIHGKQKENEKNKSCLIC